MEKYTCRHCGGLLLSENLDSCGCIAAAKEEASARRSAAVCSPCEPLRRAYSRDEMRDASVRWMIEQYGRPVELDSESKDRWHERCGMLYHFIFDHFPAENDKSPDAGATE